MVVAAARNDEAEKNSPQRSASVTRALLLGLIVQILLVGLPLLDLWVWGSIRRHVEAAYPQWGSSDVRADTMAIAFTMVGIGGIGVLCWLIALLVTRRGRGMRVVISSMFVVGISVLASVAGYADGPYHPIVPLWLGLTTFLISTATGIVAVIAVWRRKR